MTAPVAYGDSLQPYSMLNRVSDVLGLARALGHEKVAAVIGHDWGAPTAQWCARVRPDVFQSVVSMSKPFFRAPTVPLGTVDSHKAPRIGGDIYKELASLPRPRKHYSAYVVVGRCRLLGVHLVKQAGHSIPEEQPEQVNSILLEHLRKSVG